MPAILTHHLFGIEIHDELAACIGGSFREREAFLLGNQGPDPMFCLKALPAAIRYRSIGTRMHTEDPTALLAAMHRQFVEAPYKSRNSACKAYALGFLCHYLLDSSVHLLVYAQQYALCDVGVEGLTREHGGRELHALIETELDEYALTTKRGTTVATFSPHREVLACDASDLIAISEGFTPIAVQACSIDLPKMAFASSVAMYRAAQAILDSKREGVRRHVDYAKLMGKAYLHVQSLTHAAVLRSVAPYANNNHYPWPHPFEEGQVVEASFDELYDKARARAIELIPQFARDDFSLRDIEQMVSGINFYGQRVRCLPDA